MLAGRGVSQVVQIATSIALARLLVPDDFGLIAMAVAVGGLAKAIGDFGVSALLVQRKDLDSEFSQAAFTLNTLIFLLLALIQLALAPVGGIVMGDPRVVAVIAVLALALPIRGISSFLLALLRRQLAFAETVRLNLLTVGVSSAVACSLAAIGAGVWSLVAAQIAAPAAVALRAWSLRPAEVRIGLGAARRHAKEILSFGKYATGNSVVNYLVQNMDYLLIGRLLPAAQLGFYYFSFEKSRILSRRVLDLYGSLALPVFSRMQENVERVRRAYQTATVAALVLIAPTVTLLAFQADLFIPLVFGDKWEPAVLVFKILSVHVIVNALTSGVGSVLYAVGRPDISFRIVRWMVVPLGVAYFVGAKSAGIVGVAVAVAIVKSVFSLTKLTVCFRYLGWAVFPTLLPALIAVAGAAAAGVSSLAPGELLSPGNDWVTLILAGLVFVAVFGLSQVMTNRSGLEMVWRGTLGPSGLRRCEQLFSTRLRAVLSIPAA